MIHWAGAITAKEAVDEALGVVHYFPTEGNPVYMRQMRAEAGKVIGSHRHTYEHYSVLCEGRVRAEYDGHVEEHEAPAVMVVPAGIEHQITALTDIVWLCVHGTTELDRESVDAVLIGD
jgi:quercetin dioxygenase-like cupin family protein